MNKDTKMNNLDYRIKMAAYKQYCTEQEQLLKQAGLLDEFGNTVVKAAGLWDGIRGAGNAIRYMGNQAGKGLHNVASGLYNGIGSIGNQMATDAGNWWNKPWRQKGWDVLKYGFGGAGLAASNLVKQHAADRQAWDQAHPEQANYLKNRTWGQYWGDLGKGLRGAGSAVVNGAYGTAKGIYDHYKNPNLD